jgi:hypothetical protein
MGADKMKTLVVMPEHGEPPAGSYHTAVVPPSVHVTAKQTITYGMGSQNTVTLSSRSDTGCLLSLQRGIVTLEGKRIERQEIPLPPLSQPEPALALAAELLVTGCPPDKLYEAVLSLT